MMGAGTDTAQMILCWPVSMYAEPSACETRPVLRTVVCHPFSLTVLLRGNS